ncbi:MAG: PKD domain-containing protein, partial [Bacteroidota bacterium]
MHVHLGNIRKWSMGMGLWVLTFWMCIGALSLKGQVNANFTADATSGCAPLTVRFTDLSTGNPDTYLWNFGNGNTSVFDDVIATYTTPGTYTVTLRVADTVSGQTSTRTETAYITVFADPLADFNADVVSGCAPLTVNFTDASIPGDGNIVNWTWDFGDGNVTTGQNPSHTYLSAGTFSVTLVVEDDNGCSDSHVINDLISVTDVASVDFTATPQTGCTAPLTVDFNSTVTPAGTYTYLWDFGDGTTSTAANPTKTYNVNGDYDVTLTITDVNGCSELVEKQNFILINNPLADFYALDTAVCTGRPVQFINQSIGADSYFWTFGDGNTSTAQNPSHSFAAPGTYSISLTANNSAGCSDIQGRTAYITVYPSPAPDFTADRTQGCQAPMLVNFTDQSIGNIIAWDWNFGNGNFSSAANPTTTFNAPGLYTVSLTVTTDRGCTATETIPNYIQLATPDAEFATSATEGCAPLTINFLDLSTSPTDPIVNWVWNFGDGNVSNQQNPNHTYTAAGDYTVTLTVTTASGCQDTEVFQFVEVGVPPVPDFVANPRTVCVGQDVNFVDQSLGNVDNWVWVFGDGTIGGGQNPTHAYGDTGTYTVNLIAEFNGCRDTVVRQDYITVVGPLADFVPNPLEGCQLPLTVNFFDQSVNATSWFWTFDDGTFSTQQNPSKIFTNPGTYNVTLTVTDSVSGCTDQFTLPYQITDPTASFTADQVVGCVPFDVNFTNLSFQSNNYVWDFGDGTTTNVANPTHTYQNPGTYTVTLYARGGNCEDTLIRTDYITVIGPQVDFNADQLTGCAPLPVTFTSTATSSSGITNWIWDFGDGNSANGASISHTYNNPGSYDVTLTVIDGNGCTADLTKTSYVNPTFPDADFTSDDTISCPGSLVRFRSTSTGIGLTYLWDFGDGTNSTAPNPTKLYPGNGSYNVQLTVTDANGCSDTEIRFNYVEIGQPTAAFAADSTSATCPPLTVNFTDQSSADVVAWNWDFGDGSTSTLANPGKIYTVAGTYDVRLIVTNNVGCRDTLFRNNLVQIEGPTGSFSFAPTTGCRPLNVSFSVDNPQPAWTYDWDFGDGTGGTGTNVNHVYFTDTTITPILLIEDDKGCVVSVTSPDQITIQPLPQPSFTVSQDEICLGQTVQFTNTSFSKRPVTSLLWDFGDGNTSTATNPSHTYLDTGNYVVNLLLSTVDGCSDTLASPVVIRVNAPPAAIFDVSNAADCVPFPVAFSDSSTGAFPIVNWEWDFGDGDTDNGQIIAPHIYDAAGIYTATLTVTDTRGCTGQSGRTITANGLPPVDFDAFRYGCAPIAVSFTDQTVGTSPAVAWQWDFGDGTQSFQQNPTHTYSSDGQYTVSLTITDANGCVNTLTRNNYIQLERPIANFNSNATVTCPPQLVSFNDLSIPDTTISYLWDFGDGTPASTFQNPQHTYYGSDTFDVTLIITNIFGCADTLVRPEHVINYPRPQAAFNLSDSSICEPATITFTNASTPTGAAITGYRWDFGTGSGVTTPNASFTYVTPGSYTASLEITDANGCQDTAFKTIFINPNPVADFRADDTVGCAVTSIRFTDLTTGTNAPVLWEWEFGDGGVSGGQNPAHTYFNDGAYTVTLKVQDNNGCRDSITKTNYINLDHPDAAFTIGA